MSEMGAADFKAHCLQVMERVRRTGKAVVVTRRGVPLVKVVPVDPPADAPSIFGCMADKMEIVGDVLAPLYSEADWEAFQKETAAQLTRRPRAARKRAR